MAEIFKNFDVADYLSDEEDIELYFESCVQDDPGDGSLIKAALADIAKARSMTELAKNSGISRQGIYKALSENGNPEFSTIVKLIKGLGFELKIVPASNSNSLKINSRSKSDTKLGATTNQKKIA